MKIRSTLAIAFVATAGLALAACTGAPAADTGSGSGGAIDGTITFQTWSLKNDKFTPYFQNAVKQFEKKYPKATVKWVDQPADGYEDKVLQQAEAGELPDVVNLPPSETLAQSGQLVDLSKDDAKALGDYVQGGLDAYTYDSVKGVYGLPWYLGTELNYWNTDLLKKAGINEPPKDVDTMFADAKKLASATKVPMISSVPSPKTLVQMAEGTSFMKDGKFSFNTPAAQKLVQQYADLYKVGAISAAAMQGGATANTNVNDFYTGKVAWTTATPNYPTNLKLNGPTVLPHVTATTDFGRPPLFVQGISVASDSKNKATAIAFANFITNNENQVAFVKLAVGFYPGTKAANKNPSSFAATTDIDLLNESMKLGAAEMDQAEVQSPPQYTDNMNTYATQQIALAVQGKISAEQALANSVKYCDQNMSK